MATGSSRRESAAIGTWLTMLWEAMPSSLLATKKNRSNEAVLPQWATPSSSSSLQSNPPPPSTFPPQSSAPSQQPNTRSNQALLPHWAIPRSSSSSFTRNNAPLPSTSPPPPSPQTQRPNNNLHPIVDIMREQELGKLILTLTVPIAIALVLSKNGNSTNADFILVGLMMGCMIIWNGNLLRNVFPSLANVLEQVGISLVVLLLYCVAASVLPKGIFWAVWIFGGLCLLPFIISLGIYMKQRCNNMENKVNTSPIT